MNRVDFEDLVDAQSLDEYRVAARKQIASWLHDAPINDNSGPDGPWERARRAVRLNEALVEDYLVILSGIGSLNRSIEEVLANSWPQRVQSTESRILERISGLVSQMDTRRSRLEILALELFEAMSPMDAAQRAAALRTAHRVRIEHYNRPKRDPTKREQFDHTKTNAIVHINAFDKSGMRQSEQLKRLALFFDEIHYVLPGFPTLKESVLEDPTRVEKLPNGEIRILKELDPVRDLAPALEYPFDMLPYDLQRTLTALLERGVASELDTYGLKAGLDDPVFDNLVHLLAQQDAKDPVFAALSGTTAADYHTSYVPLTMHLQSADAPIGSSPTEGDSINIFVIPRPDAVTDSIDLTTVLYAASSTGSYPVFTSPRHRGEIAYRYRQFQEGLRVLEEHVADAVSPADFKARFGEVTFTLATGITAASVMEGKSIDEVLDYRDRMEDARRRFLSEHLIEATELVQNNPWGKETQEELEKFVRGRLASEILSYQDASKVGWEKVFGTLPTSIFSASRDMILGTGAADLMGRMGGVVGNVLPNTSPWHLAVIAALAASRHAPPVIEAATDLVLEGRKSKRSSIAYLAEFTR